jgi:hypothetical protein
MHLKLFHKIAREGTLLYSFFGLITLTPKHDKDTTIKKENYKPISLMRIDVKILNKIQASPAQ